jgi:single-stranded-DNA-specific exonuclease
MEAASHAFSEHGGHHMSGGFAVSDDAVFTLNEALNEAYAELGAEVVVPVDLVVDAALALDEVFGPLRRSLAQLAPFGVGNPKPLFAFSKVVPTSVETFGKAHEHLKLTFKTTKGPLEAIAFFASEADFTVVPESEKPLTLLAHIEDVFFMGRQQMRLRIVDIT